jgi:hypothetical protein
LIMRACEEEQVEAVVVVERFAHHKVHGSPRGVVVLCGHKTDGGAGTVMDV